MKKNKRFFIGLGICFIAFCLIVGFLFQPSHKHINEQTLEETKSLITLQQEYENDFKTDGYTIDHPHIILDPYHNSPLTALMLFETKHAVTPKVTVVGKDKHTTYTQTFQKATKHYISIYGLYADKENSVIISYEDKDTTVEKNFTIKTEKLPDDFILPTSVTADKNKLDNELYFFTPSSKGYTCAYDINGDVRWYLSNPAIWDNTRLENGHMLISTERLINHPYYMSGLYEIDLFGKIYVEYSLPGGYHHDYFELPNHNLLVASNDFSSASGTVEDYIVELHRETGEIVRTFDLKDLLKKSDGKNENWSEYDWFHNNSVWYDEPTNSITLSGRHQDAVINIDYASGQLNWIIGDPTGWSEEYQKYFFTPKKEQDFEWQWSQHAAMITPEGYAFILDNGNNKSKHKDAYIPAEKSYTRGVMYQFDTEQKTIEQIWQYGKERGHAFYSPYISDVDYLDKNHYIVHSGGIVYVDGKNSNQPAGFAPHAKLVSDTVELMNDAIVFEIILPTNNYRVEKMPLYNDTVFTLGKGKRLGTLGKTEITNQQKGSINNYEKMDENYQKHNIKITKEEDRLVVSGQFKRDNQVNVVLYQNHEMNSYNIKVSKHPYTALCVDIFTEEENENGIEITKYINEEGLSGTYDLFLEIDGHLYNTELLVDF